MSFRNLRREKKEYGESLISQAYKLRNAARPLKMDWLLKLQKEFSPSPDTLRKIKKAINV